MSLSQPLRFRPGIETPDADEHAAIEGIVQAMTHQSEKVASREGHAVRASHAKSTALLVGELRVHDRLAPELAQGLFAAPGGFDVAIRFAQGPGETLADCVGTHRGLSIKVFGVEGEKLSGHEDDTQDFVLASGPTFPSGTAQGFLKDEKQLEAGVSLPEGVKSFVSSAARNLNRALHVLGTESPKADFFGHPFTHPLTEPYYSQAPLRFGDHVAKVAAFPAFPELEALREKRIDISEDPDAFRHPSASSPSRRKCASASGPGWPPISRSATSTAPGKPRTSIRRSSGNGSTAVRSTSRRRSERAPERAYAWRSRPRGHDAAHRTSSEPSAGIPGTVHDFRNLSSKELI